MKNIPLLHDLFLNILRRSKSDIAVCTNDQKEYLGVIRGFDNNIIILDIENDAQIMLYRINICSVFSKEQILK